MKLGAVFPQLESGTDPAAIRAYAQAVEAIGFDHILAYDHVLGAGLSTRPDWTGPYNSESLFHEVFVLFGYLAAVTTRVELVTGVLILPQRQTALVAKQAAEIDVLRNGRFRLGIGVGWNDVEYEALGENFRDRGVRSEEQIALLRALWQEQTIDFAGRWHTVNNAGLNPLPARQIPIWIGGYADATLDRIGAMADGWFPWTAPDDTARARIARVQAAAHAAGRDPATIGLEAQLSLGRLPRERWAAHVQGWRALGATHLCINTMGAGYRNLEEHVAGLRLAKEIVAGS